MSSVPWDVNWNRLLKPTEKDLENLYCKRAIPHLEREHLDQDQEPCWSNAVRKEVKIVAQFQLGRIFFDRRIKELQLKDGDQGITKVRQEDMAHRLNLNTDDIGYLEIGDRLPIDIDILERILEEYEFTDTDEGKMLFRLATPLEYRPAIIESIESHISAASAFNSINKFQEAKSQAQITKNLVLSILTPFDPSDELRNKYQGHLKEMLERSLQELDSAEDGLDPDVSE